MAFRAVSTTLRRVTRAPSLRAASNAAHSHGHDHHDDHHHGGVETAFHPKSKYPHGAWSFLHAPPPPLSHSQRVTRAYRRFLRSAISWTWYREDINTLATLIRASFDQYAHEKDSGKIALVLEAMDWCLVNSDHPDKYNHPTLPGGVAYMRPPSLPDKVIDWDPATGRWPKAYDYADAHAMDWSPFVRSDKMHHHHDEGEAHEAHTAGEKHDDHGHGHGEHVEFDVKEDSLDFDVGFPEAKDHSHPVGYHGDSHDDHHDDHGHDNHGHGHDNHGHAHGHAASHGASDKKDSAKHH